MKNKITKGKVKYSSIDDGFTLITVYNAGNSMAICNVYESESENVSKIEAEANAELIAEAFNVTNESGFTPSELLAQRNELLEIVKKICVYKDKSITENYTDLLKLLYVAQTAINNTTK